MKIIPIIGLLYLIKNIYYFKSTRALLILINGFIYHGYRTLENKNSFFTILLRNYDIIVNMILTIYTIYLTPITFINAFIGTINFIIIHYISTHSEYSQYLNEDYTDFLHVLCVQYPLFFGLDKCLEKIKS